MTIMISHEYEFYEGFDFANRMGVNPRELIKRRLAGRFAPHEIEGAVYYRKATVDWHLEEALSFQPSSDRPDVPSRSGLARKLVLATCAVASIVALATFK